MGNSFLPVVEKFESEMFSKTREFEIAEACEFELFKKNEDNLYTLGFNREDETFSICLERFEENQGDWIDTIYLETYPMDYYNREFLLDRIMVRYKVLMFTLEGTGKELLEL